MITIHERKTGESDKVRVTFTMPAALDCVDGLYLVGWFDEWDEAVYRMERASDDTWSLTLELEPGCEYLYGYRTLSGKWMNDPAAPVAPAQFGAKNSFVIGAQHIS